MFVAVDVHYQSDLTRAAAVAFAAWTDVAATREIVLELPPAAPYVPGEFYRRELPALLAVLAPLRETRLVIVDGFVWLDAPGKPGLGAHLHAALGGQVAVVGVAKTRYRGAHDVIEVLRGQSASPLHVGAIGLPVQDAADGVRGMAGEFRVPTLLRRVDQLARGTVEKIETSS
jgi:deoxyribonuclease V